jgi:ferredoxin
VLPSGETLLAFSAVKDAADPGKLHVTLEDQAGKNVADTLIFGCRSCDARGFLALDKAYLEGPYRDPYYAARREATLIVARTCASPCPTCFCHWVGGGPDSPEGTDVLFTLIRGGCVLTPYTDRGALLLGGLPEAGAEAASEAEAGRAAARRAMAAAPARLADMRDVAERVAGRFAQAGFWRDHTAGCLACGACTYMCPTCQCFTITDEGDLGRGRRLRSWDSCMSSQFTREASGHNPRDAKAARMRQRVSHKYSYSPQNAAIYSCTGCGRCIRYCPVSLDIREIVLAATAD